MPLNVGLGLPSSGVSTLSEVCGVDERTQSGSRAGEESADVSALRENRSSRSSYVAEDFVLGFGLLIGVRQRPHTLFRQHFFESGGKRFFYLKELQDKGKKMKEGRGPAKNRV